ncbi:hypothetical protein KCP69_00220 [Salmonella enterica subsp. enterica]|nr:hypothetical protein KCP69_00220 [Salmonella enterica subsp. enterica]
MNKIDMLDDFEPRVDRMKNKPIRVWLSAQSGVGIPQLSSFDGRLSGGWRSIRCVCRRRRTSEAFYQLQAIEERVDGGRR